MKRGKGICAFALFVAMGIPVVGTGGASGVPAAAIAAASAPTLQFHTNAASADPGTGRGGGSGGPTTVAQGDPAQSTSDPGSGRGGGSGGSSGAGGSTGSDGSGGSTSPTGGSSGTGDAGSSATSSATSGSGSTGGGAGGSPQGGTGGRGGTGSSTGDTGTTRSTSGTPASSTQSQSNGQQGRGGNGGSGQSGSDGKCTSSCHVSQQPGAVGNPTFVPLPAQNTSPAPTTPSTNTNAVTTTPTTTTPKSTPPTIVGQNRFRSKPRDHKQTRRSPARPAGATRPTGGTTTVRRLVPASFAGALTGLLRSVPGATAQTRGDSPQHSDSTGSSVRPVTVPLGGPSPLLHFVTIIPLAIWIALGAAFAFAAVAGAAALWTGHRVRRQAGQFAAMSEAAMTDALTGVLNRRGFVAAADRELARARRYERPFVLAYIDVRGLKAVNDSEGHRAGDELLQTVASLLAESARADDVVGRLGGDEMGLLLGEQTMEGAEVVTRRIAAEVAVRRDALGLKSRWDLTIGTAAYPQDGETIDELLRVADARLYEQRGIEIRDGIPAGMPVPR